ncbi:hypothetical protein [Arthrobacter sp. G119Y2]|uniref:hypothetical protein n=1 Tax=Arthrobacter sp. G119Y2 TaxID=3134965 RepID=UPI00311A8D7B
MDNSERTGSWQERSDGVYIREVRDPAGGEAGSPLEDNARAAGLLRPQPRRKPFRAAWILTGILIGIGLLWMGGAFETVPIPGWAPNVDPETGMPVKPDLPPLTVQLQNLASIAPAALLTGLASAAALLITQGALRSRELQQSAPAPAP